MRIASEARVDSYKNGHHLQRRKGTAFVSSYIEARGVEPGRNWKETVFAGMDGYLKEYMDKPIVTRKGLERMTKRVAMHGTSYNVPMWEYILDKYDGFAPVRIQALPEGSVVPLRTPLVQVVNEDPQCEALGSWLETQMLRAIWYPTTVATLSFHVKRIIAHYMDMTAGHRDGLDFKLHDFGARGVSSSESAQIGGAAHLMNFMGTDTFEALEYLSELYDEEAIFGYSVDAAEHSTVTSFGGPEYELEAYEHQLDTFGSTPNKLFSVVSDSYDHYGACRDLFGDKLKARIVKMGEIGSKLVIRPDSGDPVIVVVDTLDILGQQFGFTINQKGYKVLPPYIGVLQGDGINETSIRQILSQMMISGWSAENIVFGMGGQLLQGVNRDTLKFAMKASAAMNPWFRDGDWYDIIKSPKTDSGKKSFGGRLAVVKSGDEYKMLPENQLGLMNIGHPLIPNLLETVYSDTKIRRNNYGKFQEIRTRVNAAL